MRDSFFTFVFFAVFMVVHSPVCSREFTIISQTDSSLQLLYVTPRYTIVPRGDVYTIITSNNVYLEQAGMPRVPRSVVALRTPRGASVVVSTVSTISHRVKDVKVARSVGEKKHGNSTRLTSVAPPHVSRFPTSLHAVSSPFTYDGSFGVTLDVFPFSVHESTNELCIYDSIVLNVLFDKAFEPGQGTNDTSSFFINHSTNHLKKSSEYTPPRMLVICPPDYLEAISPLVKWKNQKGIITSIITTDTTTTPGKLTSIIADYYHNQKIRFALIVGDTTRVRQLDYFGPSDNAYGFVDGNDAYPEVMIGRFAGKTVDDIKTQAQRTIDHEKGLYAGKWLSKFVLVASDGEPGANNEFDYEHMQNIRDTLLSSSFTSGDELYDGTRGGNDAPGNPTAQDLVESFNAGKGLLMYSGHSDLTSLSTTGFSTSNIKQLSNNAKLPVCIMAGCNIGSLDADSTLALHMLTARNTNGPTGALCMLASTVDQWWNPPMAAQDCFASLIKNRSHVPVLYLGDVIGSCFAYINKLYHQSGFETSATWSLFGDPSLQLFTSVDGALSMSFDKNFSTGQNTLAVNISHPNTLVTISVNDSTIASQLCSSTSETLSFPPIVDTGMVTIVASGFNLVPYTSAYPIIPATRPFINIKTFVVHEAGTSKNNIIEPGDTISVSLAFINLSTTTVTGASVSLITEGNLCKSLINTHPVPTLLPGESTSGLSIISLVINDTLGDQFPIDILCRVTYADGSSTDFHHELKVQSPQFSISGSFIRPTKSSNTNQTIEPGEIVTQGIIIKNTGHAPATLLDTRVSSNTNFLLFTGNISSKKIIPMLASDTIFITVIASNNTPRGFEARETISITTKNISSWLSLPLKIGSLIENFETNNLSSFNWENDLPRGWYIDSTQAFDGSRSLASSPISHLDTATIRITFTSLQADTLQFWSKTSCEQPTVLSDHTDFYDHLGFFMDGYEIYRQGGITGWQKHAVPVAEGTHFLKFAYIKDEDFTEGDDKAWIDFVHFPYFEHPGGQSLLFTSTPDSVTRVGLPYSFTISTNVLARVSPFMLPPWMTFDSVSSRIYGTPSSPGTSLVILAAQSGTRYANLAFSIRSTDTSLSSTACSPASISPNPSTNYIIVNGIDCSSYTIYSAPGTPLKTGTVHSSTIWIDDLLPGYYILALHTKTKTVNISLIKQ